MAVVLLSALLLTTSGGVALAAGKPGYPDRVSWGGISWQVKTSRAAVGPGPNVFAKQNVWVDAAGLHLQVARDASGTWTCAEVVGPTSYGYGTYSFVVASDVSAFDPNMVLGLFTWTDKADRKSTRLNSSHIQKSRMPSSA